MILDKIILATANPNKVKEIKDILDGHDVMLHSLADLPHFSPIEEDGATFEENALKKAREVYQKTKTPALADDSGLEIDALDGRPGVLSARYSGKEHDDEANLRKVLDELKSVPFDKRTARFHCVIAFVGIDVAGQYFEETFHGACEGWIIEEKRGTNGFGYDPIFWILEHDKTMAELDPAVKNQISHRAVALKKFKEFFLA